MRITLIMMFLIISINLIGCSSMSGNVVPQNGITMEQAYDNMELDKDDIKLKPPKSLRNSSVNAQPNTFQKLPNPELKMYVYPHLATDSEVPIPGYFTVFNVYTRDYYALPYEMTWELLC
jgi:conjugative transfer region lipoprotein (TIGR03751 family)